MRSESRQEAVLGSSSTDGEASFLDRLGLQVVPDPSEERWARMPEGERERGQPPNLTRARTLGKQRSESPAVDQDRDKAAMLAAIAVGPEEGTARLELEIRKLFEVSDSLLALSQLSFAFPSL